MVLNDLGSKLANALSSLSKHTVIDEEIMEDVLKEITKALLSADVNVQYVVQMKKNIVKAVDIDDLAGGINAKKMLEKAVFNELCNMLDGGDAKSEVKAKFVPKKGKPNVVMFVGLQGCGKTTTCTKYASYYARKGFKPALVCADTFRAGAFDQLKQNATKAKIPFYGSYTESDPAKIAAEGVQRFKEEKFDLIIVDTSGRHKQSEALFEEMRAVDEAVNPTMTIYTMDSSMGQMAKDQAEAFKSAVDVGAVIMTKTDGHSKGGGAIAAVAATKSPIIFVGTGEHLEDIEAFDTQPFVSRLLGLGDWQGLMEKLSDVVPEDQGQKLVDGITSGQFTMRLLYEQFQNITKMGPMSQVMSMIPGMADALPQGSERAGQAKIKRMLCLMDSMSDTELDTCNMKILTDKKRMIRIARGAGKTPQAYIELLEEFKRLAKMMKGMKGMKMPKEGSRGRGGGHGQQQAMQQQMLQMMSALPPQMRNMFGGEKGLMSMMQQMEKDPSMMNKMMGMMGNKR